MLSYIREICSQRACIFSLLTGLINQPLLLVFNFTIDYNMLLPLNKSMFLFT